MGVYDHISLPTPSDSPSGCADNLTLYLNNFENISAIVETREIDGTSYVGSSFTLSDTNINGFFGWQTTDQRFSIACLNNGTTQIFSPVKSSSSDYTTWNNMTVYSYVDEDCILLFLCEKVGMEIMLVTTDKSTKLIGYKTFNDVTTMYDISTLTYEDINDPLRITYSYTNMFPYAANSGTLDFLAQAYFVNSGVRKYLTTVLKECSTVTLLSTVSLPSPLGNHLAIGAHCIVPLDEEEG